MQRAVGGLGALRQLANDRSLAMLAGAFRPSLVQSFTRFSALASHLSACDLACQFHCHSDWRHGVFACVQKLRFPFFRFLPVRHVAQLGSATMGGQI